MTDWKPDWKRKLAAYLHDPPSKCLDIRTHGERSAAAFRQAGFTDEAEIGGYFRHADHTGAAADRFPFPQSQPAAVSCVFDGVRNAFRHPLSGGCFPFHAEFKSVEQGFEGENSIQPRLSPESLNALPDDDARWRARFFAHWRLWPKFAADKDYRLSLLPADTRLPDHSIWTHMQLVSALAGCVGADRVWRPAFLKLQLGPVQEFIAQARSTRDLWSGSYLLSWLMAAGLKALSAEVGPDAVIFPNLRGQPLFDLHWKKDLWGRIRIGSHPVWESIQPRDKQQDLLTPNLPNLFLALVPTDEAGRLAREVVENAIRQELTLIAGHVWDACAASGLTRNAADEVFRRVNRRDRFERQVGQFLSVTWQATPWPQTVMEAMQLTATLPLAPVDQGQTLRDRVQAVVTAATKQMPADHRDRRYYTNDNKTELNNVGVTWALLAALNSWQLDSVRQTRNFDAWNGGGWEVGAASNKDSLTGRDEAVAGGRVWLDRCDELAGRKEASAWHPEHGTLAHRFKHDDWVGAVTLIKRLWDITYLRPEFGLDPLAMPNTHGVARHEPMSNSEDDHEVERLEGERYYAVLALDGDHIGRWVSGDLCPPFRSQLAGYPDGGGLPSGVRPYFERMLPGLLATRRPVSPSYHLQFSESLSNFALLCARPVVEAFAGRLIYAGGDDVVAMLPADTAIPCARALRTAFRGAAVAGPDGRPLFHCAQPGFLSTDAWKDEHGRGRPIPFLVPGPAADCSVGIAIAHFKDPLQDVVREAQRAEKRAKHQLGRSAVAVTLLKRSGETIEWGCQWDSSGVEAYTLMIEALRGGVVSGRFPHRIVELVEGYRSDEPGKLGGTKPADGFDPVVDEVLRREVGIAAERQRGPKYSREVGERIQEALATYVSHIAGACSKVKALIGLCQTVAFIERNLPDATPSKQKSEIGNQKPVGLP